ncbi:MAG TPA: protein kinase [Elusimicrobiota bacterium]|nr:protein kinase [Elusimicrobiota bacterium]
MRRLSTPLLLLGLVAAALSARAQDDADKDAPVGTASPAIIAWRAPQAPAARPPLVHSQDSIALLRAVREGLAEEADGKAKTDLLGALSDLESGAAQAVPDVSQAWIDGHLGNFNEVLRTLPKGTPAPLLQKADRAAAKLNARSERWQDSLEFAEKALAFDPDDRETLISRSQANTGLADFAHGYADAERALQLSPDAAGFTARAAAAYGLGNYLQAAEDAKRALALAPEDKTAFQIMKLSEGRTKKVPDFERTAAPQLADTVEREYHGMTEQLNQVQERRDAPLEELASPNVARMVSSAGAKLTVKDYYGAVEDADKALAVDPNNTRALYYRAAAHNLIGEYGEASRDATRGLAMQPNDAPLHDARAWAYNRMGRFVDAIADAHAALEADPKDGYALANRAYADEQRGDYESMAEDYKAAAALNAQFEPTYEDAARRHGLTPQPPSKRDKTVSELDAKRHRHERSFFVIFLSSLLGGMLVALGILHVTGTAKTAAPAAAKPPATGIEADYALGKALGQGGMGIVYEAYDKKLKRPVAIKMLRDEFKIDESAKKAFMEEARTVAELHHPAIVDIHNIIEDERGLYLIFERLQGKTLDVVLSERKRLTLREVKDVLKPVCDALIYAHGHDVVHRDLKPSNVMLTQDGVKVLDFGISRHAARAGKANTTQTVTGTPHYMAPEQEYGIVQKENDVFSLGAVLYEMLTGVRPYEGAHQAKLAKSYIRASTRLPGMPLELDELIDRCLEPDAEKRLQSPAEFWRLLAAVPDYAAANDA